MVCNCSHKAEMHNQNGRCLGKSSGKQCDCTAFRSIIEEVGSDWAKELIQAPVKSKWVN
jgi:hypothetical protein